MEKQYLKEDWKLHWQDRLLETEVPFSVYSDLLKYGEIEDPYYRDNEKEALPLSREDYTYETVFDASADVLKSSRIWLRFDGVDTLADITLNGTFLGNTYNMHREWEFPVKDILKEKDNKLEIYFHSPIV